MVLALDVSGGGFSLNPFQPTGVRINRWMLALSIFQLIFKLSLRFLDEVAFQRVKNSPLISPHCTKHNSGTDSLLDEQSNSQASY
jgi:hypothetical protein